MKIEIWSDVVCPWCYIGKRRFEQALAELEGRDEVEVVWRSFELDPEAPRVQEGSSAERLAQNAPDRSEVSRRLVHNGPILGLAYALSVREQ